MIRYLVAASATLLCSIGPALAIAPQCQDQLRQLSAQMQQQGGENPGIKSKYDEARRLCDEHKEQQAQDLALQIRGELGRNASGGESSGSSVPQSGTSQQK